MRVAFDQQVFLLQEYGGISRYICSLAKELALLPEASAKIIAPLHFNGNLSQLGNSDLVSGRRAPKIPKTFRFISAASTALAHMAIRRLHPDIIHETYFSRADFKPRGVKRVVTVYDMIHEKFAQTMPQSQLTTSAKRISTTRADHVLCISHSTQRDLIELFGIPAEKTSVVHLASDQLSATAGARESVSSMTARPYLLYVGSRGGYKNFDGLLRAYASSSYLQHHFNIVSFGGGGFDKREHDLRESLGIRRENLVQVGGGDEILAALYEKAAAFVYPSLYEGFGIPPLEAMSLGCPVILSNTSSLPEVVGDAGEYFDPADIESMRVAIEAVLQSQSRQGELVAAGYSRNAMFSWQRCARETYSVYQGLL